MTLGEIATITRGGNFQKKDFVKEGFPCIHYGQMYTHFGVFADQTLTFVSADVFSKSKQAMPNDIVMAVTSENVADVCKCTAWLGKEPIAVSGHTAIIHHMLMISRLFRIASIEAEKMEDRNNLYGLFASIASIISIVIAVIAIVKGK